jgi:hypothetical protein
MSRLRRRVAAIIAASLLAVAAVVSTLADEPVIGNILVTADHVSPGGSIGVSGYQLDPGSTVDLTLTQGTGAATVGAPTVEADGTFSTTVWVPSDFADGYAELVGTGSEGGRWVASVLIDADGTPNQPASRGGFDPQVVALTVLAIGVVIFVAATLSAVRGGARKPSDSN